MGASSSAAVKRGESDLIELEKRYVHVAGHVITALVSVSCVRDEHGEPLYQIAQIQDITSRRQAERVLRDTQARLSSALQAGSIGTWTWDIQNDRLVGDEFIARMFSIDVDAAAAGLPVESYLQMVHEPDRRGVATRLEKPIDPLTFINEIESISTTTTTRERG